MVWLFLDTHTVSHKMWTHQTNLLSSRFHYYYNEKFLLFKNLLCVKKIIQKIFVVKLLRLLLKQRISFFVVNLLVLSSVADTFLIKIIFVLRWLGFNYIELIDKYRFAI